MKKGLDYSFSVGLEKLTLAQARQVKAELVEALEINTPMEVYNRKRKWRNIPQWAYTIITAIFSKYGIPENEVWDIKEIKD